MPGQNIRIEKGTVEEAVALSREIPEFKDPHDAGEYRRRLGDRPHLILIAFVGAEAAGFKVGYERSGCFYSWMGAVLPAFRRLGVAAALQKSQENWVKTQGYTTITFKTRNHHKGMLIFALSQGFDIIGLETREKVEDYRIILRKELNINYA